MTTDTAIGLDDPGHEKQSGIEDEDRSHETHEGEESVLNDAPRPDLTREDIEKGNDLNTQADQLARAPKTNKLDDDGIELGR